MNLKLRKYWLDKGKTTEYAGPRDPARVDTVSRASDTLSPRSPPTAKQLFPATALAMFMRQNYNSLHKYAPLKLKIRKQSLRRVGIYT